MQNKKTKTNCKAGSRASRNNQAIDLKWTYLTLFFYSLKTHSLCISKDTTDSGWPLIGLKVLSLRTTILISDYAFVYFLKIEFQNQYHLAAETYCYAWHTCSLLFGLNSWWKWLAIILRTLLKEAIMMCRLPPFRETLKSIYDKCWNRKM